TKALSACFEHCGQSAAAVVLFEGAADVLALQADKPQAQAWVQAQQAHHFALLAEYAAAAILLKKIVFIVGDGADRDLHQFCRQQLTFLRHAKAEQDANTTLGAHHLVTLADQTPLNAANHERLRQAFQAQTETRASSQTLVKRRILLC
ncbi:MAG: hypothetical protein ACPG8W_25995, partial [Candidatus Promineifilaceae bacterium]